MMNHLADQNSPSKTKYLADYAPPGYLINEVDLSFDLDPQRTRVKNKMSFVKNPQALNAANELCLDGQNLELVSIKLNGKLLEVGDYQLTPSQLLINDLPDQGHIEIVTLIKPDKNTALSGLYLSGDILCTQCEAEGFRRMSYFCDRPDVLSTYTVRLSALKADYPVLLANGHCIEKDDEENGRHFAVWHDPFVKPCYLFALVAGHLERIHDTFITQSGRKVELYIYANKSIISQCEFAMEAIKSSMDWDEKWYGREYDLDVFMVVAIDDFNAGAMENKGLNIFNTKYVLAEPKTATDQDYLGVESVIAHEYFHNWSGDRVTCRDWFQLSLKEGFTVFRDQQFTASLHSEGVKRIDDVNVLRTHQFAEDAGPIAHPVRPESYQQINNFYTLTVYNKGAEVVRMLHTLLGEDTFRAGCDLYFDRHDNQAVTVEDFIGAHEQTSSKDLSQFMRWYTQFGTPRLQVEESYDEAKQCYRIHLKQSAPHNNKDNYQAVVIPVVCALLDSSGQHMDLTQMNHCVEKINAQHEMTLELNQPEQVYEFNKVTSKPTLSVLRRFSAPVILERALTQDQRLFLASNETDPYNRWYIVQALCIEAITKAMQALNEGASEPEIDSTIVDLYQQIIEDQSIDDLSFKALLLQIPSETYLSDQFDVITPQKIHQCREQLRLKIARQLAPVLQSQYDALSIQCDYAFNKQEAGRRALKNTLLGYISLLDNERSDAIAQAQFTQSNNMTDQLAGLVAIVNSSAENKDQHIEHFYQQWQSQGLVMDKWLSIQAMASVGDTLEKVKSLTQHAVFNERNPNKVYSLIRAFAANHIHFHHEDGKGYEFIREWILKLDSFNPQVASRVASTFSKWRLYEPQLKEMMLDNLKIIQATDGLSADVSEIIEKTLLDRS